MDCGFLRVGAVALLLLSFSFVSCSSLYGGCESGGICVVAHRGGASLGAENTLPCIERAIEAGVDAVEVDVRMTSDGGIVVIHDATVDRTTTGRGRVDELSLAEICALPVVDCDTVVAECHVPSLAEVLKLVAGRVRVLIEVKDDDARGIERAVVGVVGECNAERWVSVQAFSDRVLARFRDAGVQFPLEKLFVFKLPLLPYIFDGTFTRISSYKYSHVKSFNVHSAFVRKGLVRRLRSMGKDVKVWKCGARRRAVPGVCGVITDYPQLWR